MDKKNIPVLFMKGEIERATAEKGGGRRVGMGRFKLGGGDKAGFYLYIYK